ncbi:hypothetical protein ACO0QE_004674 [Hanseniaspora vineae]
MPVDGYASLSKSSNDSDEYDYHDPQLIIPESQLTCVDSFDQERQIEALNDEKDGVRLEDHDENGIMQSFKLQELTSDYGYCSPNKIPNITNSPMPLDQHIQLSNIVNAQRQKTPSEAANIPDTVSPAVETPKLRWSLRKRKAIQKMPYSLDKIFHQELLRGHKLPDLQDIDASQLVLRLPELSKTSVSLNTSASLFWDYENEDSDDEDFEIDVPAASEKPDNAESFENDDAKQLSSPSAHSFDERFDEEDPFHKVSHRDRKKGHIIDEDSQSSYFDKSQDKSAQEESAHKGTELIATVGSSSEFEQSQPQSDAELPEDIIFRGKVVNLKHGYKGVLPKAAWEAQLRKQHERERRAFHKRTSNKDRDLNKKGVAKKKRNTISNSEKNQFLQDLLANSSQEESVASVDFGQPISDLSKLPRHFNEAEHIENLRSRIDLQYADAYQDDDHFSITSSSSSSHNIFIYDEDKNIATIDDYSLKTKNKGNTFCAKESQKEKEAIRHASSEDSVIFQDGNRTLENSNLIESAEEYDITDYMLSRDHLRSKPSGSMPSTKKMKSKHNSSYARASKSTFISTKLSNNQKTKPKRTTQTKLSYGKEKSTCFSDCDSDLGGLELSKTGRKDRKATESFDRSLNVLLKNTKKHSDLSLAGVVSRTKPKRKKKIAEYFAFTQNRYDHDAHKKLDYYTTVVEAPGSAFTIGRASGASIHDAATTLQPDFHDEQRSSVFIGSPVFQAILDERLFVAPDTVSISVGENTFTVSALSNDYLTTIKRVLVRVVKVGATDIELTNLLKALVQFTYHKNNLGLLHIVQAFQKEFTKKLLRVKDRAKPIHFFTLATCHLMLYEILLYSSVTSESKKMITELIIESLKNYFCTYTVCYTDAVSASDPLISESHFILKIIVKKINGISLLWQRFTQLHLSRADVFETAVNLFPPLHDKPLWNLMLPFTDNYFEICEYVKFIQLGINMCNWHITSEMILQFYGILKRRKFMDYKQELTSTPKYDVVGMAPILEANSVFNFFLNVLNLSTITISLLEKITPLGNLVESENPSQLPNRLNLLLMLALKTGADFENKIEQLLAPALATVNTSHYKVALDSLLSLYIRKDANGLVVKALSLPACYTKASSSHKPVFLELWIKFISGLKQALLKFKSDKTNVLVSLNNIMLIEIREKVQTNYNVVCALLDVICSNIAALEPNWVYQNTFQILSFENNDHIFKYYCKILTFLIEHNHLTLWNALNYNQHISRLSKSSIFLFYDSILRLCNDETSFLQVTPYVTKVIVKDIFETHSLAYLNLVKHYFNRHNMITKQFVIHSVTSRYENICQIINFIGLSKDMNAILLLMQTLKSHCDSESETILCQELVNFINRYLIDLVKNNPIFHYLKQKYNISNTETEKSIFKDKLRGISSLETRSELIVDEFSQVIQFNLKLQDSIEKVYSAVREIEAATAFKLLTETINSTFIN